MVKHQGFSLNILLHLMYLGLFEVTVTQSKSPCPSLPLLFFFPLLLINTLPSIPIHFTGQLRSPNQWQHRRLVAP